ncbi:translocation/assembly module TamB domain-containing protein [Aquabacterium sp.]|uniref:translocation/assembly module TamB domain-containing protein n=1 Tax=Aquabacterium sp. TaxID=1872578 RepID=UPI0025B7C0C3|nr:translocation/assembly module TamB domain-containing protein [Aquabacterium sp.]
MWLSAWAGPLWLVMTLLVLIALSLSGLWWALHQEVATARLLSVLPWVTVVEPKGGLLTGFSAQRVEISLPRGSRLVLVEPHWQGVSFRHDGSVAGQVGVTIDALQARSVDLLWISSPPSKTPSLAPTDFDLPVSVRLKAVTVGAFRSNLLEPQVLQDLAARVFLQESVGTAHQHQVVLNRLLVHGWQLKGLAALGTRKAMNLDLSLDAEHAAAGTGSIDIGEAQLRLKGPLHSLLAQGQVQLGQGTEAAQSLTMSGEVAPFAAWPLPSLAVQAHGLNLAMLWPALPNTALSGKVSVQPTPLSAKRAAPDLAVDIALTNAKPGAWDARGLPLVSLVGQAALPIALTGASAGQLNSLGQAGQLALTLALPRTGGQSPGTVLVNGTWDLVTPQKTHLQADIQGLEPQALDGRSPPLQLQGRVNVQSAPAEGQAWERWAVLAELKGQYRQGPGKPTHPVALNLAGHWSPALIDVKSLSLSSGTSLAKLTGQASQAGEAPWRAKGQLDLSNFDPQWWMPWPDKATGANRLQGRVQFEADALGQGEMAGRLDPSQLAGIPLSGLLSWKAPTGQPDMSFKADLNVAGNQVGVTGVVPVSRSAQDGVQWAANRPGRGQLQLQAPAIQALQPLAQWWGWRDLQGMAQGDVTVEGVWPALSTQGHLDLTGLQAKDAGGTLYSLEQAEGRWRVNTGNMSAQSEGRLTIRQAKLGGTTLEQVTAALDGSAQSHRLVAQGDVHLPVRQEKSKQPEAVPRVHLDLSVAGGVLESFRGWKGQVQKLSVVTIEPAPRPLLSAQAVEVQWSSTQDDRRLVVSPTLVSLMGAGLKIQELSWREPRQAGVTGGQTKVSIDLEPIKLAEVLARWQPQAGWGGDLTVVGQLRMQHSPEQPWQVDGFLARRDGDLSLAETAIEGNLLQTLGIKQARLELKAREGVWTMSEQFDGRVVGLVSGQQTVRTPSRDSLPSANDSLSGTLNVKIDNLRPWGVWAPPGWRLSGQVQANTVLSGTLGAPLYKGEVNGQNLGASQALMGVNLSDGVLQLSLQGDQARLTQFKAKGGEHGGTISLDGDAMLGAQPQANLNLALDHFALLQRVDRRLLVSGQGKLVLGAEDIKADGRFLVDEGLIDISKADAPTIGDDVNVINRPGDVAANGEPGADAGLVSPKRKVQANIEVDLGSKLRLKGRGLNTLLVGKLTLTTPNGRMAMHGTVRTESGSYVAYAQNLVIERGSIAFTGPIDNPRLDIQAMRAESLAAAASDVKVGVTITGTAQDPRVRLYSDPTMSETEKLSWLILGRGPAGLGGADIGLLQTAASALLAGEGGTPKDSVLGAIGLDELSVRQTENGDARETVVNVGKQISRKWYLGYERSLNETAGNWQLIYRLAQRFTVRAQAGRDNALDLIWSWRFD